MVMSKCASIAHGSANATCGNASTDSSIAMQQAALKETDSSDLEVLLELNRNYVRSALESDVRWYAENLSEDFYITAPDGVLLNREAFLKRIANPYPGTHAEPVDVKVRI